MNSSRPAPMSSNTRRGPTVTSIRSSPRSSRSSAASTSSTARMGGLWAVVQRVPHLRLHLSERRHVTARNLRVYIVATPDGEQRHQCVCIPRPAPFGGQQARQTRQAHPSHRRGGRYRHEVVTPVREAELQAMAALEPGECRAMIAYVNKFMNALERRIGGLEV